MATLGYQKMTTSPIDPTGKYRVYCDGGQGPLYLVQPMPGFLVNGVIPEWTPFFEAGYGFSPSHAQDQINLLWWDYGQHCKVTKCLK